MRGTFWLMAAAQVVRNQAPLAAATFPGTRHQIAMEVQTSHSFTGRQCAASRYEETRRADSIFQDPFAYKLAGPAGLKSPMGGWIMVPRTRYGDDFLRKHYYKKIQPCRQVVLLGAGMDARAYRMMDIPEAVFFEVDQQTTFDVKEPLLRTDELRVADRKIVPTDFSNARPGGQPQWAQDLLAQGFDTSVPTVWLLEGLMMYLTVADQKVLMHAIGELSPVSGGSAVFFDAISENYVNLHISVSGADFVGGSDDYAGLWRSEAGFNRTIVRDFESISIDRRARTLRLSNDRRSFCSPGTLRGKNVVLFVESEQR